jgi:hypothetical protein
LIGEVISVGGKLFDISENKSAIPIENCFANWFFGCNLTFAWVRM